MAGPIFYGTSGPHFRGVHSWLLPRVSSGQFDPKRPHSACGAKLAEYGRRPPVHYSTGTALRRTFASRPTSSFLQACANALDSGAQIGSTNWATRSPPIHISPAGSHPGRFLLRRDRPIVEHSGRRPSSIARLPAHVGTRIMMLGRSAHSTAQPDGAGDGRTVGQLTSPSASREPVRRGSFTRNEATPWM